MRNTNLLFLTSVILLSSLSLTAKDDDKNKGFRAGWQTSNYFLEGSQIGTSNLNAFYVGYFHETKILPMLFFHSGLDYFQNGYSSSGNLFNVVKYTNHVLSIPLALKLKIGPVFALAGTGLNFTVAQNYKLNGNSGDVPEAIKTNFFDMPLVAGLGVKISIITIEARYHWGMFDASKSDLTTVQSQYFQIGAGISF